MRYLILLCLTTTVLSAQVTLQLEQGITVSDNINHKPIGLGLDYQLATWKGFDFSVGVAFEVDPVYFQGQSRVHYLVATVGWRL